MSRCTTQSAKSDSLRSGATFLENLLPKGLGRSLALGESCRPSYNIAGKSIRASFATRCGCRRLCRCNTVNSGSVASISSRGELLSPKRMTISKPKFLFHDPVRVGVRHRSKWLRRRKIGLSELVGNLGSSLRRTLGEVWHYSPSRSECFGVIHRRAIVLSEM